MSITLFVGDVSNEVCDAAHAYNASAQLIDSNNLILFPGNTYYTSLADCNSLENFNSICKQADTIYYIPPEKWSDTNRDNVSDQKKWTEYLLRYYQQTKTVHNLSDVIVDNWIHDIRHYKKQFWAVGCSITAGVGVKKEEAWPDLISTELNLPYTNLSVNASSIIWQSDQICRSDIHRGDIVFWGVTNNQRLPIMKSDGNLLHLTATKFSIDSYAINNLTPALLDNATLKYQNILAIRRAYNYCQRIGAFLVPLGLIDDIEQLYTQYNVPVFYQLIQWGINQYVDLGTDGTHPGPNQHKIFSKEFLSHYKRTYS